MVAAEALKLTSLELNIPHNNILIMKLENWRK